MHMWQARDRAILDEAMTVEELRSGDETRGTGGCHLPVCVQSPALYLTMWRATMNVALLPLVMLYCDVHY